MSPFKAVIGVRPRIPIDLVLFPTSARPSADAKDLNHHMHQVHEDVRCNITTVSNESYKQHADTRRRFVQFSERDLVMVCIHPERLPPGAHKKLHHRMRARTKF